MTDDNRERELDFEPKDGNIVDLGNRLEIAIAECDAYKDDLRHEMAGTVKLEAELDKLRAEKEAYRQMYVEHLTTQCPNVNRSFPIIAIENELDKEAQKILAKFKEPLK